MGVKIVAVSDVMELHYTTITPQLLLNGTALIRASTYHYSVITPDPFKTY